MKHIFRFLEWLLPFLKQPNEYHEESLDPRHRSEKRYIICLLILWLVIFLVCVLRCNAHGQALKVGDKVPDITFTNVLNYPSRSLRLSDFKGKVVVLDFWATYCGTCVAGFPHEYQLQNELPDKLQIILVNTKSTRDSPEKVTRFLSDRKNIYQFPSIVGDTILDQLFPHRGLPHFVMIKDNEVIAIPDISALTADNIKALYQNKSAAVLQDLQIPYDDSKEVFEDGNGGAPTRSVYHTSLYAYKRGLPYYTGFITDDGVKFSRIFLLNHSRLDFILYSLSGTNSIRSDRIIIRTANPSAYSSDSTSESWREKNFFIYEATFSPRSRADACSLLQADIRRFFGIKYRLIVRDTTCIVLSVQDTAKILKGIRGQHAETNLSDHFDQPVFFRNSTFVSITGGLEAFYNIPVINECHYSGKVCLNLPANLHDFKAMNERLLPQGLKLSLEKRPVQFLLIEDDKPGNTN